MDTFTRKYKELKEDVVYQIPTGLKLIQLCMFVPKNKISTNVKKFWSELTQFQASIHKIMASYKAYFGTFRLKVWMQLSMMSSKPWLKLSTRPFLIRIKDW